jgi:hypothetical protein
VYSVLIPVIVHYLLLLFEFYSVCLIFAFIWFFCSLFVNHKKIFISNPGLHSRYFWERITGTGQPKQVSLDRSAWQVTLDRTEMTVRPERDTKEGTTGTGQPGWANSRNRTSRTGQLSQVGLGFLAGEVTLDRQGRQDCQDMTARTEKQEFSRNKISLRFSFLWKSKKPFRSNS